MFDGDVLCFICVLMVVVVIGFGFGMCQFFCKELGVMIFLSDEEFVSVVEIICKQFVVDVMFVLMGDKSLLFLLLGNVFIMYVKQGCLWVVLFDFVGVQQEWFELIWCFIEMVDVYGGCVVFYKMCLQMLLLYFDVGLCVYKLGEEVYVLLFEFSLKGLCCVNLCYGVMCGECEGLLFEIVFMVEVLIVLDELCVIFDEWLCNQNVCEKGFLFGVFDDCYICSQFVVVVCCEGVILVFVMLMCLDVLCIEVSVDLMCYCSNVLLGMMDFLFGKVILYFQVQGYQCFGLGMVLMLGMVEYQFVLCWYCFGWMMFWYGVCFYNFRGLCNFKDKFELVWEVCYLFVCGGIVLLFILMDVVVLIGGGLKGVIFK